MNSNLSFAKVRKNILFSKFLANYLNIRVYFMALFTEKSQKMVLFVRKTSLSPLITHRFPLSRIEEAYDVFENRKDGVIKVAIFPG